MNTPRAMVLLLGIAGAVAVGGGERVATQATSLATAAAAMQAGEWRVLQTVGWNNAGILEPCGNDANIVEYADGASWDPISRQVLFVGNSHGTCYGSRFVVYSEATNAWRTEPLPPTIPEFGSVAHAYHHNTIDPATGDTYYIHYGALNVYRYTTNGARTWTVHSRLPLPRGVATCCRGIEYFPELGGLVYVDGTEGVWIYRASTGVWRQVANTALVHDAALPRLTMGQYDNVTEYNPAHRVLVFGGGRGAGRIFYAMDASGAITRKADAPADVLVGSVYSLNSVDPVSGRYLFFDDDGTLFDYDVVADQWSTVPGQHPLATRGFFEAAEAPIATYGVNLFFDHNSRQVWLYKHAPGTPPAPLAAPQNFRVVRPS